MGGNVVTSTVNTETAFSFTTTDTYNALWGDRIYGIKLLSGHSGVDKYIKDVRVHFTTSSLSTGTLYYVVLDENYNEVARSNGVSASSISSGWVTDSFSNAIQIKAGYTVGATISTGTASSWLGISTNNNQASPTNTERTFRETTGVFSTSSKFNY